MARIIVLEDEASTRALVAGVLKKLGHEVSAFDNGAEGLLMIMAELPDLVVSDVQMPKITGFEVLTQVRQDAETVDMPFILLTSLSDRADIRYGLSHGASDYITKPFQPQELIDSVRRHLERALLRQSHDTEIPADDAPTQPAGLLDTGNLTLAPLPSLEMLGENPAAAAQPDRPVGTAWLVQMAVQNEAEITSRLSPKEWRAVLRQLFIPAGREPSLRAAQYLDLDEHRLTLTYCDAAYGAEPGAGAAAAAQAVDIMMHASNMARQWAAEQFAVLGVPALRVAISVHHGEIAVRRVALPYGGTREVIVGAAADLMARVRQGEPPIVWKVLATQAAFAASQGLYKSGAQMETSIGNAEVHVHALQGLVGGQTSWI